MPAGDSAAVLRLMEDGTTQVDTRLLSEMGPVLRHLLNFVRILRKRGLLGKQTSRMELPEREEGTITATTGQRESARTTGVQELVGKGLEEETLCGEISPFSDYQLGWAPTPSANSPRPCFRIWLRQMTGQGQIFRMRYLVDSLPQVILFSDVGPQERLQATR